MHYNLQHSQKNDEWTFKIRFFAHNEAIQVLFKVNTNISHRLKWVASGSVYILARHKIKWMFQSAWVK